MSKLVISSTRKLEFANYRKIRATSAEAFAYFGYQTENELLELSQARNLEISENLRTYLKNVTLNIELKTERAHREFIIAPIISEVLHLTKAKLRANNWFEFHPQLKGYLSYYFRQNENLLLIESAELNTRKVKFLSGKNSFFLESGMNKSFTQLGVELIALDKAEETSKNSIYGVITNGNTWQFARLDRKEKIILLDLRTFDIFADFEVLIQTLAGTLETK